ncbi:acetate--CoA ligase family protein [Chloroflexota bacterium]
MIEWPQGLEQAFNPKAIAVVGIPTRNKDTAGIPGLGGSAFINGLIGSGFPGHIYPINRNATKIQGLKAYPSLASVPEHIDLVIVAVPAHKVAGVLKDCIKVGTRNIVVFSSGFSETGEDEGKRLEQGIAEIAKKGGLNVIGPNCMGICYAPRDGLSIWENLSKESGPVAFISQSGGLSNQFVLHAEGKGIRFSKVISYGNACVLDSADLIEYLATDPETEIICLYIEGTKDGQKLARIVRETNLKKPVIIWKGGEGESGAKAIASHTGSLAGNQAVWDAFFKQTGAVQVHSLEEMADITLALLHLPPPEGLGAALLSGGGGFSVMVTDAFYREGLGIPNLSPETMTELKKLIPPSGSSINNPLDVFIIQRNPDLLEPVLRLVANDPSIDMLLMNINITAILIASDEHVKRIVDILAGFASSSNTRKPLAVLIQTCSADPRSKAKQTMLTEQLVSAGVLTFHSSENAAHCLAKFAKYHRFLREAPVHQAIINNKHQ